MALQVERELKLHGQRFIEKFGREPGEGDTVFFDPDAVEPQQLGREKAQRGVVDAMKRSGIQHQSGSAAWDCNSSVITISVSA